MKKTVKAIALILCLLLLFVGCTKTQNTGESETGSKSTTQLPETETETESESETESSNKTNLPPSDTVFFTPSGYKDVSFAVMNGGLSLLLSCPAEWETKATSGVEYAILRNGVEIGAITSREPDTSGFDELERDVYVGETVITTRVLEGRDKDFRYRYSYRFKDDAKERTFTLTVKYEEADSFTARRLNLPLTDRLISDPGFGALEGGESYRSVLIVGNSFIGTSCVGDALRAMLTANNKQCSVTDVSIGMALVSTFTASNDIVYSVRTGKYDAVFLCGLYNMDEVDEVVKMKRFCDASDTDLILFPAHNEERSVINKALASVDGISIIDWKAELDSLIASGVNTWELCINDYYRHSTPLAGYVGAHMIYRAMYGSVPTAMNRTPSGIDTSVAVDILGDYASSARISYTVQKSVCIFVT